jgi:hypothetical protein
MNKIHQKRIDAIKKKLNCELENCGSHFIFEATEATISKAIKDGRKRLIGKCSRCQKVLKLTDAGIWALGVGHGKPTIKVIKSNYENLFE